MECEKTKRIMVAYELAIRVNQHLIKNNQKEKLRDAIAEWILNIVSIDKKELVDLIDKDLKLREKDIENGYEFFEEKIKYYLTTNEELNVMVRDISNSQLRCAN